MRNAPSARDAGVVALPSLVALAACIGNARRVVIKPGWPEPAVLWGVIVAVSGEKKSPCIDASFSFLRGADVDGSLQHMQFTRDAVKPGDLANLRATFA
jgi:hypothetical protein